MFRNFILPILKMVFFIWTLLVMVAERNESMINHALVLKIWNDTNLCPHYVGQRKAHVFNRARVYNIIFPQAGKLENLVNNYHPLYLLLDDFASSIRTSNHLQYQIFYFYYRSTSWPWGRRGGSVTTECVTTVITSGAFMCAELVAVCPFLFKEEAQKHAYSLRGDGEIRTLVYQITFGGKQFLSRVHIFIVYTFWLHALWEAIQLSFPSLWVMTELQRFSSWHSKRTGLACSPAGPLQVTRHTFWLGLTSCPTVRLHFFLY